MYDKENEENSIKVNGTQERNRDFANSAKEHFYWELLKYSTSIKYATALYLLIGRTEDKYDQLIFLIFEIYIKLLIQSVR